MSIVWEGVDAWLGAAERVIARVSAEGRAAVAEAGAEMEKLAKQNASGRPGPNVITGTLRRSIRHSPVVPYGIAGWSTDIGPSVVYGRRIELGFHGADSRGRPYNQGPFPYMAPAHASVVARLPAIYAAHMRAALAV